MTLKGYRYLAAGVSMVEVVIYIVGLGLVLDNLDQIQNLIAYALGYGSGVIIGSKIEEKMALGYITVNVITSEAGEYLPKQLREKGYGGKEIILGIRPEDIHDEPIFIDSSPGTAIKTLIDVSELMGAEIILYSTLAGQEFIARVDSRYSIVAGEDADLALDMNKAHFFDVETEERIR